MYYASRCDLGDRKREQNERLPPKEQYVNEDSTAAVVFDDIHRSTEREAGLFVVADGAGGEDAGDVASYLATSVISEELADYVVEMVADDPASADVDIPAAVAPGGDREDPEEAITEAIQAAQARIVEYAKAAEDEKADPNNPFRAYTTVVAGIYDGEKLHYGWVGDSRAYVINTAAERIAPLTKDHSEVQALEDAGAVNETEALVHPDSHKIRRAVGGTSFSDPEGGVEVDTGAISLYEDDVMLFTSDGLIDAFPDIDKLHRKYQAATDDEKESVAEEITDTVVTDDDIRQIVLEGDSLEAIAERFIEFSNDKGGKDNLSILLAHPEGLPPTPDPLPARGFEEREEEDIGSQNTIIQPNNSGSDADSEEAAGTGAEGGAEAAAEADADAGGKAAADDDGEDTDAFEPSSSEAETGASGSDEGPNTDVYESGMDADASEPSTEDGGESSKAAEPTADDRGDAADGESAEAGDESTAEDPTVRLISNSEESYTITEGDTIGRGNDADVEIDGPPLISRVHAKVVLTDDSRWRLIDKSGNGTHIQLSDEWKHVHKKRTPPLRSGMLVALGAKSGDCIFEFQP